MKQYWQDANGEKMRSSSKSSDVVISGNPLHGDDDFGPAKFAASRKASAVGTEMTSRSADEEVKGVDDFGEEDDLIMDDDDFTNVTAEQGEIELGSYALPKKPRSLHNNDLRSYTKLPAPPSRTDYSAHGHMASKSLRSRIGYTIALLKCAARVCAPRILRARARLQERARATLFDSP